MQILRSQCYISWKNWYLIGQFGNTDFSRHKVETRNKALFMWYMQLTDLKLYSWEHYMINQKEKGRYYENKKKDSYWE